MDTAKYENQSLPRGECGQFVNDVTKAGMGDSFQSKVESGVYVFWYRIARTLPSVPYMPVKYPSSIAHHARILNGL